MPGHVRDGRAAAETEGRVASSDASSSGDVVVAATDARPPEPPIPPAKPAKAIGSLDDGSSSDRTMTSTSISTSNPAATPSIVSGLTAPNMPSSKPPPSGAPTAVASSSAPCCSSSSPASSASPSSPSSSSSSSSSASATHASPYPPYSPHSPHSPHLPHPPHLPHMPHMPHLPHSDHPSHLFPELPERFLPPPVDATHVITSAAPTSLPIELPAIRDNHPDVPPLPAHALPPIAVEAAAVIAADIHHQQPITPFERWSMRASESQFNAISGAIGGFTSGIFTCPLDVIKTKLQAQGGFSAVHRHKDKAAAAAPVSGAGTGAAAAAGANAPQGQIRLYKGLVGTARVIWRDEGLRGLYRGLGPIVMGYLPTWAVWFTVYNKSKLWMGERYQNTIVINFWSSIIAGASSTLITNPIWVIKTRLMSQMPSSHDRPGMSSIPRASNTPTSRPTLATPWHYNSTLDAARKMYTTEGVLSFYSGLTPALLGLTHVAVQFPAYEYLKTKFTGLGMGESPGDEESPSHWVGVLSATILSKIMASSLTYPHEVIRTRLQTQRRHPPKRPSHAWGGWPGIGSASAPGSTSTHTGVKASSHSKHSSRAHTESPRYKGVITTFRTILREEGWHAFYAGLGTNMMRAVPAATVTMLTYEYVMRSLKQTRKEAYEKLEEF